MKSSVVGHTGQKEYFRRMVSAGSLSHAYLLHGPQGVGKRMLAGEFAAQLLSDSGLPLENNPDVVRLQPGIHEKTGKPTEIPADSVRDMKSWAYQRPLYGVRKVVLIDDAERMSDSAANTLLKVLEEPPAYLYFLLVTSRPGHVQETITSRCQEVAFYPLKDNEMASVLSALKLDSDDLKLIAAVASGRPGEALRLVRDSQIPVVASAIAALEKMISSGTSERIVYAKKIADDDDLVRRVSWWLAWTHTQLSETGVSPGKRNKLPAIAAGLLDLYDAVSETKNNRRLVLEKFMLELPAGV